MTAGIIVSASGAPYRSSEGLVDTKDNKGKRDPGETAGELLRPSFCPSSYSGIMSNDLKSLERHWLFRSAR